MGGGAFRLEEFRSALIGAGAEFLALTNEWELLRYRLEGKVGVIYFNKKGRASPSGPAGQHYANFDAGRPILLSAGDVKRERRATKLAASPTLYTDASAYCRTKSAVWAAILVLPDGTEHEAHGQLRGDVSSSTSAEARAVANALHHFVREGTLSGPGVRIVCDNTSVVNYLKAGKCKSKSLQIREAVAHIQRVANGRLTLFAEWIKGHQSLRAATADPRVSYNRRCDALAKAHAMALDRERRRAA